MKLPAPTSPADKATSRGVIRPALGIHATNVTGFGATVLMRSLVPELIRRCAGSSDVTVFLPESDTASDLLGGQVSACTVSRRRRVLPNSVSRFIECILPPAAFSKLDVLIVLGDLPLRSAVAQVVYVHQAHLVSPRFDVNSSRQFRHRVARLVFRLNARYAQSFVVQTEAMRRKLTASYEAVRGKVWVIAAPPPAGFETRRTKGSDTPDKGLLRLFYPAASYPHKNHRLLARVPKDSCGDWPIDELILTIADSENPNPAVPWIRCVGLLDSAQCMDRYATVDAVVFLSTAESYGLPLVEAMACGLPVICPDLEYARTICGEGAIYFDPQDINSLQAAVVELHRRLAAGWRTDWRARMDLLPRDWGEVAARIAKLIEPGAAGCS